MRDEQVMTPEDRKQLLEEQGRLLDFQGRDKPTEKPPESEVTEEEWARKEKKRQDEDAALVALRNKPQSVGQVLMANVALCRKVLDPRVILEAAEIGMDDAALAGLGERMERWVESVRDHRDGETRQERRVRLGELEDELFPERLPGCGCAGTGFVFTIGDFSPKEGVMKHDVEHVKTCGCDRGEGKRAFMKTMGGQKGRRRKGTSGDAIPF